MKSKKTASVLMLFLTVVIWGFAFVAQSTGMDYMGPFTFTGARFLLGGLVLLPFVPLLKVYVAKGDGPEDPAVFAGKAHYSIRSGILCGIFLFAATIAQQIGIQYTAVGKAGFITALYIIIVPIFGIFLHKPVRKAVWLAVLIALCGMYLLCMTGGFSLNNGDLYMVFCAVAFSVQIMLIDSRAGGAYGIVMSCSQFFTVALLSALFAFPLEHPTFSQLYAGRIPVLYCGIMSSGVAYTLQIMGQKNLSPAVASLIMSLESVCSAIAGWLILGQTLSPRELAGCGLMFFAIILAQLA